MENLGIPILPEIGENIFEEGFRSEDAKQKYLGGTGFGLSFAKKIIGAHDGEISFSSNLVSNRNIFGLLELENIINSFNDIEGKFNFLNQNLPEKRSFEKHFNRLRLAYADRKKLKQYERFILSKSERINSIDYLKRYFKSEIFDKSENIDIFYKHNIDKPIYLVKFIIKIPRRRL